MADWQNWTDQFRSGKYGKTTTGVKGTGMPVIEVDPSDPYASSEGRGMQLSFFHVPSQKAVYFKAFIVAYNESFSSDWASETVYGRTDPIYMFKGTQRQISLNFKVPAFSEGEAYENLGRVQKLTQYLYPSYVDEGASRIIGQSPLIRMKVMNLAQIGTYGADAGAFDNFDGGTSNYHTQMAQNTSGSALFDMYRSTNIANQGILGVISSVQIDHNLEAQGVLEKGFNTVLPKLIDVSVTFNCIHEQTIGFDQGGNELAPGFPYNVILEEPYDEASEAATFNERAALAQAEQNERDVRQQQLDDAEARYGGMFGTSGPFGIGGGRLGRDRRRAGKGKLNPYEASAYAGATDEGVFTDSGHGGRAREAASYSSGIKKA
jgi:hypothetical protein